MWAIKITLPHCGADVGLAFLPDDYCFLALTVVLYSGASLTALTSSNLIRTPTLRFKTFIATMIHI